MTVLLVLAGAVLAILVWVGRRPTRLSQGARLISALVSAVAAVAAVVSAMRGGWIATLILIAMSAWLGARARTSGPGAGPGPAAAGDERSGGAQHPGGRSAVDA